MQQCIITCNAGSSSIKFSIFSLPKLDALFYGEIDGILENPKMWVKDCEHKKQCENTNFKAGYPSALKALVGWIENLSYEVSAIGHRVVHGGKDFTEPTVINEEVLGKLSKLIPLAPLHQPHNIEAIEALHSLCPDTLQVACFDTAFHHTQSRNNKVFAIPKKYEESGVIRYGFHGLSYQYIASVLPGITAKKSQERVIVAHLGNGASMCAMQGAKSVATTMGFTALDGLIMGTRCGSVDPGVILYLIEEEKLNIQEVSHLLYEESGLKALSGVSHDMRDLLKSNRKSAKDAVDLFCYQAAKQLVSLVVALKGLDVLVFTAGIGEGSPVIRKKICDHLLWLGVSLDEPRNDAHESKISTNESKIDVYIVPTNEELVIAQHTLEYANGE